MSTGKFFKVTKEAILLYIKGELNEENLLNLINNIRKENEEKDEAIWEETLLIKKLFEIKKYYEVEDFIKEFSDFLNNMSYQRKGDTMLINASLESIEKKLHYRVSTQIDFHIFELLKLNYIKGLNTYNIKILFKNSDFTDKIIGIDVASNYAYKQMSFVSMEDTELREELSKENFSVKEKIQKNIKSIINSYYDIKSLKDFANSLNSCLKNIKLNKKERNFLLYTMNLKMSYYTKIARKTWKSKNKKREKAIKAYSLLLNFK